MLSSLCRASGPLSHTVLQHVKTRPALVLLKVRALLAPSLSKDSCELSCYRFSKSFQADQVLDFNLLLIFFCHFISLCRSSVCWKKSFTLLPCSSLSVVLNTRYFDSWVRNSQMFGTGKTICSIVLSWRTICKYTFLTQKQTKFEYKFIEDKRVKEEERDSWILSVFQASYFAVTDICSDSLILRKANRSAFYNRFSASSTLEDFQL